MLPQVQEMMELVTVGRVNGRHFSQETLEEWVSKSWGEKLDVPQRYKP
jgi:hypothetical protein